ncbi:CPBP family intramembrane metalloprotease [Atopobacter sp. AH10]|uniref:CPBP family intramembrane glutamic endopeptidase n=1 Tax=Atopobacter sp. AH10 TaxID=2315861 RepID=UPI000EF2432F|nr:type II CAAX endopeptidase family protein [Atopobacter sp. AH10]RLK64253.1 CPBP family intramembrane metalloprotease [Atopobacter sp. AH10]
MQEEHIEKAKKEGIEGQSKKEGEDLLCQEGDSHQPEVIKGKGLQSSDDSIRKDLDKKESIRDEELDNLGENCHKMSGKESIPLERRLSFQEDPSIKNGLKKLLKWLFMFFLSQLPMIGIIMLMKLVGKISGGVLFLLTASLILLAFLLMKFMWKGYVKETRNKDNFAPLTFRDFKAILVYFLLMRVYVLALSSFNQLIFKQGVSANDQAIYAISGQNNPVFLQVTFFFFIGLVAPLMEEMVFRGYLTGLFFKVDAFLLPLVVSSFIFGQLHASHNIVEVLMYFGLGVGLFLAYHRRRNLKDAMLLHFLNNGTAVLVLLWVYLKGLLM